MLLQTVKMSDRHPFREHNHLQAWRLFRGLTQADLAEKVGTTASVISLLENGDRTLSAKWLRKLAVPLGTSPGFLLDHHPNDLPTDVVEIWSQLPEHDRAYALRMLQGLRLAS